MFETRKNGTACLTFASPGIEFNSLSRKFVRSFHPSLHFGIYLIGRIEPHFSDLLEQVRNSEPHREARHTSIERADPGRRSDFQWSVLLSRSCRHLGTNQA